MSECPWNYLVERGKLMTRKSGRRWSTSWVIKRGRSKEWLDRWSVDSSPSNGKGADEGTDTRAAWELSSLVSDRSGTQATSLVPETIFVPPHHGCPLISAQ